MIVSDLEIAIASLSFASLFLSKMLSYLRGRCGYCNLLHKLRVLYQLKVSSLFSPSQHQRKLVDNRFLFFYFNFIPHFYLNFIVFSSIATMTRGCQRKARRQRPGRRRRQQHQPLDHLLLPGGDNFLLFNQINWKI